MRVRERLGPAVGVRIRALSVTIVMTGQSSNRKTSVLSQLEINSFIALG
jgi:hypothetical protein